MQPIGGPPAVSPPEIFFTARPKHFIVSASFGSFDIKEMDHECVFRTKPATCSGVPPHQEGESKTVFCVSSFRSTGLSQRFRSNLFEVSARPAALSSLAFRS